MDRNRIKNRKNERGAITLFVLLACLFFVFILTGVYVYNLNKMQTQEQNIKQIQENYARDINNIDEIYNELSKSIKLELTQEPENGIWSQEVTLIGNAEVKEGKTVTIEEYAFSKDSTDESSLKWNKADNGERITETTKVTESGTYYFWVKDSEGEIYQSNPVEVTNIDRTAPTAGSIIAKEENVDGTDGESGHGETTYTVKKDGITIYENIKDPVTLEESGIYEIVVTTKDNAGNEVTSKPYTIKIDKVVPVLESSNIEIISTTEAKADIKVKEELSGMRGYYISTENTEPTEGSNWVEQSLKEFTIEGLKTDTIYYLWLIDNVGNISERQEVIIEKINYQIDGKEIAVTLQEAINIASDGSTIELLNDYTDTSTVTFSKNITFDVQGYTLTRDKTITINSEKQVEITGTGKITSETNNVRTITNNGTLTISDSITIENMSTSSSNAPIYTSNSNSITNINDNVQI